MVRGLSTHAGTRPGIRQTTEPDLRPNLRRILGRDDHIMDKYLVSNYIANIIRYTIFKPISNLKIKTKRPWWIL